MHDILKQLGELVLGSIPTVCFFLVLLGAYAVLVKRPLDKVLADRYARTGGAMDGANAAIAAAEQKSAEYENRLREARGKIFDSRAARQKLNEQAREHAVSEARDRAQASIATARRSVEIAGEQARQQIESGADALSQSIVAAILPHRNGGSAGVQA